MLVVVGENGYADATVEEVLERAGHSTKLFYRYFDGKDDCYVHAYEMELARLCRELEALRAEAEWIQGISAALDLLVRFAADRPPVAKAVMIDVYAGPEQAWARRQEVIGCLSRGVDRARDEPGCLPSVPPRTAGLVVAAIESSICALLIQGEAAACRSLLPHLIHFAVLCFFGEGAAWEAYRAHL